MGNAGQPVASLAGVTVSCGHRIILKDVSFALQTGDFVALAGGNGAGKTTVLRSLLGFVRPSGGTVTLFGQRPDTHSVRSLRCRTGYVPQCPAIDDRMPLCVRDVVAIGRCARVCPGRRLRREDREHIDRSIDAVGIAHLSDRPFGQLSGGERQKAQIARALCQEPELMLLDEPTSNLDLGAQCECLDLLGRIQREFGITMLLVMHDLGALPNACNRALILDRGRLVFDGEFSGLLTEPNLHHVYGDNAGRVLDERGWQRPAIKIR